MQAKPADWLALLNRPQAREEQEAVRTCVRNGRPFGSGQFQAWTVEVLDLGMTFREQGRPRKKVAEGRAGGDDGGRKEAEGGESGNET